MLARESQTMLATIFCMFLILFCPPNSYSKEAVGTINAQVVSPGNVAIVDFEDNEICIDDECRETRSDHVRTICQGDDDVFR